MIRALRPNEHGLYRHHLLELGSFDRWYRFSHQASDEWIANYVGNLAKDDRIIAVFESGKLIAAAHLALADDLAEIGISVSAQYRGRGHGTALMRYGMEWARAKSKARLYTLCQASNQSMIRLAYKLGMRIERESGTAEAYLALRPVVAQVGTIAARGAKPESP